HSFGILCEPVELRGSERERTKCAHVGLFELYVQFRRSLFSFQAKGQDADPRHGQYRVELLQRLAAPEPELVGDRANELIDRRAKSRKHGINLMRRRQVQAQGNSMTSFS